MDSNFFIGFIIGFSIAFSILGVFVIALWEGIKELRRIINEDNK